jgi:hypothetical protein
MWPRRGPYRRRPPTGAPSHGSFGQDRVARANQNKLTRNTTIAAWTGM